MFSHVFACLLMSFLPLYGYISAEVSLTGSHVSSTLYHHNHPWSLGKGFNTHSGDMGGGLK